MRAFVWVVRIILFILIFSLGVKNSDNVVVHFFFDAQREVPLVLLLLAAFCLGAVLALAAVSLMRAEQRLLGSARGEKGGPDSDRGSSHADLYP